MQDSSLKDAALVLVGHGSTRNSNSAAPVGALASAWRSRNLFGQVLECFWMVEPHLADLWPRVHTSTAYVVPVTISEGYFTTEIIPQHLGLTAPTKHDLALAQEVHGCRVYYCQPIGTHPLMTRALIQRAQNVIPLDATPPIPTPETTSLFIAGHGTPRNAHSRAAVQRQVELIRAHHFYAEVHAAFMMEPPLIAHCWEAAHTPNLVMVPFFISDGLHTQEDIPILLGEPPTAVRARLARREPGWYNPLARGTKRLWYTQAIGSDPLLAEIVLERVRQAQALPPTPTPA